jgi:hypothetical protein
VDKDEFASSKALLKRAQRHHYDFNQVSHDYLGSPGKVKLLKEPTSLRGEELWKIRFPEGIPLEISCIVFDAISGLRAALDHAVFSAASVIHGVPEPEKTKFPFGKTLADIENEFKENGKGIPAEVRNLILGFKPCKDGDKILWGMNDIRNSKIHRTLAPLATVGSSFGIGGSGRLGAFESLNEWDSNKMELTYARAKDVSPNVRIDVSFGLAFGPTTALPSYSVDRTLQHVAEVVGKVIVALEAECVRLRPKAA